MARRPRGKVLRRPRAALDLVECAAFLAEDSIEASERFLDAAERTFQRLSVMPRMGRPWASDAVSLAGVRMWPIPRFRNYLVFYRPLADGIEVLRVLHAARDILVVLND
jgi:toxin ParE1/3/4